MIISGLEIAVSMAIDQKMRIGMFGFAAASLLLASFGFHINPLTLVGGIASD